MAFESKPVLGSEDRAKLLAEKEAKLKILLEQKNVRDQKDGLPHIYGFKWYKWARDFFESRNKINLICAANQISKSSTQIRKCIEWATNQEMWPELWTETPVQFWYLYPSQKQVNAEWRTKWSQFMPRGKYKDDPIYGWKTEKEKNDILAIHFVSGVSIYFKTYTQNEANLQTGTCDALFCDEELPIKLYDELKFRVSSTNGYFHMVFTATLGQDEWRRAMEPSNGETEFLPDAFKQSVSLFDSQMYVDGTPSKWTVERINEVIADCSTSQEVEKRVYGKFVLVGGRTYEAFDIKRHLKKGHPLPKTWFVFAGEDSGSGGSENHPAALCYVGVSPDFKQGRVFLAWRGDKIETTSGDVLEMHLKIKKENNLKMMAQYYDWSDKDFEIISNRLGDPWEKAEKSHAIGEGIINTLFKNDMMIIYEGPETSKLAGELATLRRAGNKVRKKDNLSDAFRYAVAKIPWDFTFLGQAKSERLAVGPVDRPKNNREIEIDERRKMHQEGSKEQENLDAEFDMWNDLYGS